MCDNKITVEDQLTDIIILKNFAYAISLAGYLWHFVDENGVFSVSLFENVVQRIKECLVKKRYNSYNQNTYSYCAHYINPANMGPFKRFVRYTGKEYNPINTANKIWELFDGMAINLEDLLGVKAIRRWSSRTDEEFEQSVELEKYVSREIEKILSSRDYSLLEDFIKLRTDDDGF